MWAGGGGEVEGGRDEGVGGLKEDAKGSGDVLPEFDSLVDLRMSLESSDVSDKLHLEVPTFQSAFSCWF